jgi:Tol biopolymer transport system component
MSDIVNPYIPGQPVDNPDLFFGRRDLLTSIRENLVKGRRIFVIAGAPRMGRSSLLRQLPHRLPEEFLAVRVDLLEENAQRLDWLLWRLADAIAHQLGADLGVEDLKPAWADFEAHTDRLLDRFWPRVRAALGDRGLVLLLDDVDCLLQGSSDLLASLFTVLSDWRDRDENLALVLAMTEATQETLSRQYPRLFGGTLAFTLGPLSSEEATRLITWPVDGVLTYDYGVARRVVEITSGQPYYLQLLCFELFSRCAPAGWVNQRDVDLVIEDLVNREITDFRQVWDESSPPEQAVLAALVSLRGARGVATVQEVRTLLDKAGTRVAPDRVAEALERLAARGILERLGALSYRFRVGLLRDWLGERVDLREVVRDTRWDGGAVQPSARRRVVKLSASKGRPRKVSPSSHPEAVADGDGKQEAAPVSGRRWLWIAAAVVVSLVLVIVVGMQLLQAPRPGATPAPTPFSSATLRLATATLTSAPTATRQQVAVTSPTATTVPLPTETPSPTPPLVVARSVPAIAYQSREQGEKSWSIYVMSSDGSDRTRLAVGQSGFLSAPSWSPDGARIVFASDQSGTADIWIMDSDGQDLINITQHEAKDHSPAWSPDGEWIAFASLRDSLYWELYLMRPDGSDVQRLTWWEDASDLSPTWSPDGTRLAFASKRDGNWEIYTMDRDGSNLMRLTDDPADDTNPAWSPDGGRIAFGSTRDGYAEIYVVPITGGQAVNVSNAPFSTEHGPTWSPDGGRIAFYSDRDGEWDIYVMASDGSDAVKLTGDNSNDQVPAWRP